MAKDKDRTLGHLRSASVVVVERETGRVVCELFDRRLIEQINTSRYEAIPIQTYLASLNKPKAQP